MKPRRPARAKPPIRREKAEEALSDEFVAEIAGRGAVVRFSQARATMQTPGIPDRRYRLFGLAFWWECKAADGKLSPAQAAFLTAEMDLGNAAGVGILDDLVTYVNEIRAARAAMDDVAELAISRGRTLVARWSRRGGV